MRFLAVLGLLLSIEATAESLLIANAELHTLNEIGVIKNADILINEGIVEAIGDLELSADRIIDAAGMPVTPTLLPG